MVPAKREERREAFPLSPRGLQFGNDNLSPQPATVQFVNLILSFTSVT